MKALLLALLFSASAHALPIDASALASTINAESSLDKLEVNYRLQQVDTDFLLKRCKKPEDLVTAAKALLRRYFKSDMYNSTVFDDFLWLHPEHEDFIGCVICNSGKANHPYWERDFIRMCNERQDPFYASPEHDEEEQTAALSF